MMPANTCTQRAMKLSHSLIVGLIILKCAGKAKRQRRYASHPHPNPLPIGEGIQSKAVSRYDPGACHRTLNLTPPIRRISERTQEQRHMIMLRRIVNLKDDADFAIEAFYFLRSKVRRRVKS